VFAHKTDLVVEPGQPPVDPSKQVEAMARAHFGDAPVRSSFTALNSWWTAHSMPTSPHPSR
jgi:hypothetical protein